MKRLISVLLTGVMLLGATASVPLSASAVTSNVTESNDSESETYTYTDQYGLWKYQLTDDGAGCKITYYDKSQTEIEIPSSINGLPVVEIGGYTFYLFQKLTKVTIPDSVTTIGCSSFYSCESLTSITIPNSVKTIEASAFAYCYSMHHITIPENVTYIGDSAFAYNKSLTSIDVDFNNPNYRSINGVLFNKAQTELLRYPSGRLSNNYIIPDSVTTIGTHAFDGSINLKDIKIPNSVTTIRFCAFDSCTGLTYIKIPNSVNYIGRYAFHMCYNLASITIPYGVTTIEESTFRYCYNLSSVTLPDSITTIGKCAFESCKSLTSITIPSKVTTISRQTFYYCRNLTNITIPKSVTVVEPLAFGYCTSLSDVYYAGNETDWNNIAIKDTNSNLTNATIHYNHTAPINPLAGDVGGDGVIAIDDVIYTLKYAVGNIELTEPQLANADVNGNGDVTTLDALLIQKIILG